MRNDYEDNSGTADVESPAIPSANPSAAASPASAAPTAAKPAIVEDVLIEEVSIDGMCGVY